MSLNKTLATAALAGLMSTAFMAPAFAAEQHDGAMVKAEKTEAKHEKASCKGKTSCKTAEGKEKHACKGLNSCKGNSPDGKNECKGKSECKTDGSK